MPKKHEFLSPKAISNRIKSKGLQKLRWYCQMCQKQCRDENGFKCHMTSESHQRQLLLVAENPGKVIGSFSREFLRDFMHLLRTSYGTRRVHANEVYQQYIKDKDHYHMNATRWESLTGFCMFLGKTGMCEVEPTEKGWFIKYIDRTPETLARQAAAERKKKMDKDDEEKVQAAIEEQITRALASKKEDAAGEVVYTELHRGNEEEKIVLNFKTGGRSDSPSSAGASETTEGKASITSTSPSSSSSSGEEREGAVRGDNGAEADTPKSAGGLFTKPKLPAIERVQASSIGGVFKKPSEAMKKKEKLSSSVTNSSSTGASKPGESRKRKLTALEEIREMEEQKKEKLNRKDNWITEGIIVKVMHEKLGEKFYRRKGQVEGVRDVYTAIVKMLDSGNVIKIDQAYLETVLPALGRPVLIVNGAYRGMKALLESIDVKNFCATVKIDQGLTRGRVLEKVPYEDISKLAPQ